jgi:hypothetical protein
MSTNFRAYKIDLISSGSATIVMNQNGESITGYSGSVMVTTIAPQNSTGSTGQTLDRVWGIMKGEGNVSGSLTLEGGGNLNLASLDNHQIFPCYPKLLVVSAGSIYLLS